MRAQLGDKIAAVYNGHFLSFRANTSVLSLSPLPIRPNRKGENRLKARVRPRSSSPAMADGEALGSYREFKALVEAADRKFARARDLPLYGGGDHHSRKAFKAYTRLWRLQQERRRELVAGGLRRWKIGEVASRIGQLYYARYLRTAEPRSLVGAYVFYEAIYSRGYFAAAAAAGGGTGDGGHQALLIRYKELRFIARFLVVAMLMRRAEAVDHLSARLRALVDETKSAYPVRNSLLSLPIRKTV
jgi:hypothetical protein